MAHSDDLRKRVVEAVFLRGMSRNAAAERFEVGIASAVRWAHRFSTRARCLRPRRAEIAVPTGSKRMATICSGSFVANRISRYWRSRND
jgi:transposase-like protein